ncbi:hypothetical protein ASN18_0334 [Candidatus Magnetominusculus xianensis]|uniref:Uncharacterized protein n=1 Tax=Candidatus Magnetominusculus xianensis TaxID=1748249 RepID=A0ABR5SJ23_9BACT|nr:hypothetical protein ASN18_0334 [Candidatus Magnetominusculus xianensis]
MLIDIIDHLVEGVHKAVQRGLERRLVVLDGDRDPGRSGELFQVEGHAGEGVGHLIGGTGDRDPVDGQLGVGRGAHGEVAAPQGADVGDPFGAAGIDRAAVFGGQHQTIGGAVVEHAGAQPRGGAPEIQGVDGGGEIVDGVGRPDGDAVLIRGRVAVEIVLRAAVVLERERPRPQQGGRGGHTRIHDRRVVGGQLGHMNGVVRGLGRGVGGDRDLILVGGADGMGRPGRGVLQLLGLGLQGEHPGFQLAEGGLLVGEEGLVPLIGFEAGLLRLQQLVHEIGWQTACHARECHIADCHENLLWIRLSSTTTPSRLSGGVEQHALQLTDSVCQIRDVVRGDSANLLTGLPVGHPNRCLLLLPFHQQIDGVQTLQRAIGLGHQGFQKQGVRRLSLHRNAHQITQRQDGASRIDGC